MIGIFYGITLLVIDRKDNSKVDDNNYSVIQYDEILVGNLFQQTENEYYVLATTENDKASNDYKANLETYSSYEKAIKTYRIDLDSGFNKTYVADQSNFETEFPIFSTSTLLKIKDQKIEEIYEGTEIKTILEEMTQNVKE